MAERKKIKEGIEQNMTYRQIAEVIERARSTVQRETRRLGSFENYDPEAAQKDFEEKQKLVGKKKK